MQTIFHLQKVETSVWLPEDYEIIPGKKAIPYNLERNRMIQTRPSFFRVKHIKIRKQRKHFLFYQKVEKKQIM